MNRLKSLYERLHAKYTLSRRVTVISKELSKLPLENVNILDIGCGGGEIASALSMLVPTIQIKGIDINVREKCDIEVLKFNGITIPYQDAAFDFAMLVDVLHHTSEPITILREALRVSKKGVVIKDHNCNGGVQNFIMKITDTLGNWHHDVPLVFNFLSRKEWCNLWRELNVKENYYNSDLKIYSRFRGCIFSSEMDFITLITKND